MEHYAYRLHLPSSMKLLKCLTRLPEISKYADTGSTGCEYSCFVQLQSTHCMYYNNNNNIQNPLTPPPSLARLLSSMATQSYPIRVQDCTSAFDLNFILLSSGCLKHSQYIRFVIIWSIAMFLSFSGLQLYSSRTFVLNVIQLSSTFKNRRSYCQSCHLLCTIMYSVVILHSLTTESYHSSIQCSAVQCCTQYQYRTVWQWYSWQRLV